MATLGLSKLALVAVATLSGIASAQTTWWVDANAAPGGNGSLTHPFRTIQLGIGAAAGGDSVQVMPGTYFEDVDFLGKSVTVASTAGPAVTIVHGSRSGSVVFMKGTAPALVGFTVENGSGDALPGAGVLGGGVLVFDAVNAEVRDCVIRDNYAEKGGGVAVYKAGAALRDCTIVDNDASTFPGACQTGYGGGVWSDSSATLDTCTLARNTAVNGGGGAYGAGLIDCTVEDNVASIGAGVSHCTVYYSILRANLAHSCDGSLSTGGGVEQSYVDSCTLSANEAWDQAGGARNSTLVRCVVRDNAVTAPLMPWGGEGGGAVNCSLVDSWLEGNWVAGTSLGLPPGQGGGASGGDALRSVFVRNRADVGAGVAYTTLDRCDVLENIGVGAEFCATVEGSIVRGNSGGQVASCGVVAYSDVEGGAPGTGNIDADPLFWNPPAGDLHLQRGSPCIDAGDPAQLDPDGSRSDIGAFPYSAADCRPPVAYCPVGTSEDGCVPAVFTFGTPSATFGWGFDVGATQVPGERQGTVVYSVAGSIEVPWSNTSSLCVGAPRQRTGIVPSGGSTGACDGAIVLDFNAWRAANPFALGQPFAAGDVVYAQVWYRDPGSTKSTNMTQAIRFWLCP